MYIPNANQEEALQNNTSNFRKILREDHASNHKIFHLGKSMRENQAKGVILPVYDYDSPNDVNFSGSHAPYRVPGQLSSVDEYKTHEALSCWWMPLYMYSFVHPTKETWLSPTSRKAMCNPADLSKEDSTDLFFKTYMYVKMEVKGGRMTKEQGDALTKGTMQQRSIIPSQEEKFVVQTYVTDDKDNTSGSLGFTLLGRGAWTHLMESLHKETPLSMGKGIDPNYPQYLLGDVTDPSRALQFGCNQVKVPHVVKEVNVLTFGGAHNDPSSFQTTTVTPEILQARTPMHDESLWNFPTMEEQMDFLVNQAPEIPYDIIEKACGSLMSVPSRKAAVHSTPAPKTNNVTAGLPAGNTPPPPVANDTVYTCAKPGDAGSKQLSASEVAKDPALLVHVDGAWKTQAEVGIVAAPTVDLPAPPATPATPVVPPTQPPVATTESVKSGLTAEEVSEWETLKGRMQDSGSGGSALTEAETLRITELVEKGASAA